MYLRIPEGSHNHQKAFSNLQETPEMCVFNAGNSVKKQSRGKNSLDPEKMLLQILWEVNLLFVDRTPWCFRSFASTESGDMINMGTVVKSWAQPASLKITREKDPSDPEKRLHIYSIQLCVLYIKYINLEDQQKEKTPVFNIVAVSIYEAQTSLKRGGKWAEARLCTLRFWAFMQCMWCNACSVGSLKVILYSPFNPFLSYKLIQAYKLGEHQFQRWALVQEHTVDDSSCQPHRTASEYFFESFFCLRSPQCTHFPYFPVRK